MITEAKDLRIYIVFILSKLEEFEPNSSPEQEKLISAFNDWAEEPLDSKNIFTLHIALENVRNKYHSLIQEHVN